MRHFLSAALLLALATQLGCSATTRHPVSTTFCPYTKQQKELWDNSRNARYHLRPGDRFQVIFQYQSELNQKNVVVLPDGTATMVGVDVVPVTGLTVSQLDSLLTAYYARDYINPDLSVIIEQLGKREVYVLGQVKSPGLKQLSERGNGILQAIAMAGGFKESAHTSDVLLIRATDQGFVYRHVDLSHLEKNGLLGPDVLDLQPYDIIYVPRTAVGDLVQFTQQILGSTLKFTNLFWDVYALTHLNKVDRIVR